MRLPGAQRQAADTGLQMGTEKLKLRERRVLSGIKCHRQETQGAGTSRIHVPHPTPPSHVSPPTPNTSLISGCVGPYWSPVAPWLKPVPGPELTCLLEDPIPGLFGFFFLRSVQSGWRPRADGDYPGNPGRPEDSGPVILGKHRDWDEMNG